MCQLCGNAYLLVSSNAPPDVMRHVPGPPHAPAHVQVDCTPPSSITIKVTEARVDQGGYLRLVVLMVRLGCFCLTEEL